MMAFARRMGTALLLVSAAAGCEREDALSFEGRPAALAAYCEATVEGVGTVDVETDYLPHVVACENGAADFEALKAQAVAARTYLYYKLDLGDGIGDGTGDQVYTCANAPEEEHYQAVAETSGQVVTYDGVTICAFYVAGAVPTAEDCAATDTDDDYSSTEHYVTYNWGLSGDAVEQTSLGWVDASNVYNRGCKSQNGANCLSENGWTYDDILRFYYGMDFALEVAEGDCVDTDTGSDADSDADADADSGAEPDADADSDADGDADTDSDSDSDADSDGEACPLNGDSGGCAAIPRAVGRRALLPSLFG